MRTEADMHDRQLAVIQRLTRELDAARADRDRYKALLIESKKWMDCAVEDVEHLPESHVAADCFACWRNNISWAIEKALGSGQGEVKS